MAKRKKRELEKAKAAYQPTAHEQAALDKFDARRAAATAPRLKVSNGDKTTISMDHPDVAVATGLLMEALGTADADFIKGIIGQLADADKKDGKIDEDKLNFLLAIIKGVKPNDQLEAMLAAQMAVVHVAMMKFPGHFDQVDTLQQQDSAERAINKLARTFAMQLEALKRYRTGGEQKVTVQHVSVNEGGQAIVGNVTQNSGKAAPEQPASSPPALTDARQSAMPIINEQKPAPAAIPRKKNDAGQSST